MGCRRHVGHAIKVPSSSPTNLTSDVGTGTSTSAYLTSSTTTLENSSPSGTVWSVKDVANTLPMATNREGSLWYFNSSQTPTETDLFIF